jgi:beta-N-acetylhexosaminidase
MHLPQQLTAKQQLWVNSTLKTLTLREKIGQTVQEICRADFCRDKESAREHFSRYPYGSIFCGGEIIKGMGNASAMIRKSVRVCQQASKIPLLVAGDLENGAGAVVQDLTRFPSALALGATDGEKLAYDYGRYTALEGNSAGFNWTFAPVVDLLQNWMNSSVSNRALGDNPDAVSRLARAINRGLQEHGMAACAKHFPGDGVDFRDQHLVTSINSLSEEEWWEQHGAVFRSVINDGVYTIMAGHIALPWREPIRAEQRRPRPATVSRELLTGLLRNEMNFNGVIVSDALIMAGFTGWAPRRQRLIESFNAGVDVMLWPGESYFDLMEEALDSGLVSLARLDESVRRILDLKARLGLISTEHPGLDALEETAEAETGWGEIQTGARSLSDEIARKSITLVRNRDRLLPLDPTKVKRILVHTAIPAELAAQQKEHLNVFIDCLKQRGMELTILENGNCLDVQKMEEAGQSWDAYLVIYSLLMHQLKNTIRPTGHMAEVMWTQQIVETVRPITISLGSPFLLEDMPYMDTLINAYSTSLSTMRALDQALFGEIEFSTNSPVGIKMDTWKNKTGAHVGRGELPAAPALICLQATDGDMATIGVGGNGIAFVPPQALP